MGKTYKFGKTYPLKDIMAPGEFEKRQDKRTDIERQLETLPDEELNLQREAYPSNKHLKDEWNRRQKK